VKAEKGPLSLVWEMINGCAEVADRSTAVRGIRAVCKWFGGQLLYIPAYKTTGKNAGELLGVLADEVGDAAAGRMLEKLMLLYGGDQLYIPMEKKAFKDIIAREIYERYDGSQASMRELCREYGVSFDHMYTLFYKGRDVKNQPELDFQDE